MTCSPTVLPSSPGTSAAEPTRRPHRTRRIVGSVLLGALVVLDQGTKAWAWRHVPGAIINPGSTANLGGPMNGWFSRPITGAMLDFVDFGLLCAAGFGLIRAGRPRSLCASGALMVAGWGSNLLDRLGMHDMTAPGSARGAVDFIRLGNYYYNVADVFVVAGTIAFFVAVIGVSDLTSGLRNISRARPRPVPSFRRVRVRTATSLLAVGVVLGIDVSVGAAHDGGADYSTAWIPAGDPDSYGGPAATGEPGGSGVDYPP